MKEALDRVHAWDRALKDCWQRRRHHFPRRNSLESRECRTLLGLQRPDRIDASCAPRW